MIPETLDIAPAPRPVPCSTYPGCATRVCPECNKPFEAQNRKRLFCCDAHKLAFHNRCAARGKVLIPLAMAWRTKRGGGGTAKKALAEMCRALDAFAAEDRKADRMPMSTYVERGFVHGHRS
jgi:endogenous inhibitor of DNA gyrase (YacG/DUF329 family)